MSGSGGDGHGLRAVDRRPEIPGGPQSVAEVLGRTCGEAPGREALVGRHGRLTYAELDAAANEAAEVLARLGVAPGDRVAAGLPNDVDIVVAFLGSQRLGAIWVGVNRALAPPEKRHVLADCGARVLLASADVARQIAPLRSELPDLDRMLLVDPGGEGDEWRPLLESARGAGPPAPPIDPFAPAAIAYTSGTTGLPKGAVHSQHNLLLPGAVTRSSGRYGSEIRMASVLPLTILNLMVLAPLVAFQIGSCCVAVDRIDPEGLAEWIRRERVGQFAGVPTILHDLLTHPSVTARDLESLVHPEVGGAECPEEFRRLYRERYGREVGIGYGMTEAPTAVTRDEGSPSPRPGICGVALPQVEISIRDEAGAELRPGEIGEICVGPARRGPWAGIYTPMLGYWNQPEETEKALRGDVYHSGDLGVLDEGGTLFIRGRRSELILRGGANVQPAEVERVIQSDPRVAACAVLGVPDARLGQRVVAAVELEPGAELDPDELARACAAQLARYKVPERIVVLDALPRNAMSKVVKRALEPLFEA